MWVGNLVTVVEEVDFRGVAARPANSDAGVSCYGKSRACRLNQHPHLIDMPARVRESGAWRAGKKAKSGSNSLYPTGLLLASKGVDVHVLG